MIYLIFFLACLVQGIGGFGAGLFAVPLLSMSFEPKFIVPPFALVVLLLNFFILSGVRNNVEWKKVIYIISGSFLGLPCGVFLLKNINQDVIRFFVSFATFVLGIFFLSGFKPEIRDTKLTLLIAGIFSGILSGSAAMGGPPLIFLMMSFGLTRDVFRATLLSCFLFNGIYANILYFLNGLFNHENLKIAFIGLIPAVAGTVAGIKIKNVLTEEKFHRITLFIVILIGLIGMLRSVILLKRYL